MEELLQLTDTINSKQLCHSFVETVIIGNGPELKSLKEEGSHIEGLHFLGEIYDQDILAQYMRVSSAVIIPGKVGLAVNHAFAHGLPVITRQHSLHAPEVEYIESGRNGLIVDGDSEIFLHAVVDYLNSPTLQKNMSEMALITRDSLLLGDMVKNFHNAILSALKKRNI